MSDVDVGLGLYSYFYTKADYPLLQDGYNDYEWKDEGRPYIVSFGELDEQSRETYDDTWWVYPPPLELGPWLPKCVAVTGELRPIVFTEDRVEYKGFLIYVKSAESMRVLSNCK